MSQTTTRTTSRLVRSTKLSPVRRRSHLDEWPITNTTCCNNFFFFIPFRRRYQGLQNSPALCDVVLSISQLFVPHFAMSAFACIFTISYNRTNKQPDPVFEFFSILLTFGRLKQYLYLIAICSSVKPIHAMTFFSICVPPNNPITACGATSFPGYHSFPKWAIHPFNKLRRHFEY